MFFTLTSLLVAAQVVAGICYWPNGSVDTSGYECNTTAVAQGGHTSCCLHNDACYESGSCFQDWSGIMYRQSCTDPNWKDPSCPQYCLQKGLLPPTVQLQPLSSVADFRRLRSQTNWKSGSGYNPAACKTRRHAAWPMLPVRAAATTPATCSRSRRVIYRRSSTATARTAWARMLRQMRKRSRHRPRRDPRARRLDPPIIHLPVPLSLPTAVTRLRYRLP